MQLIKENSFQFLQFSNLSNFESIQHFITLKNSYTTNPQQVKNEDKEILLKQHIEGISNHFNIPEGRIYLAHQVHSKNVFYVRSRSDNSNPDSTDAFITQTRGIVIAVKSADCVPILLYDPVTQSIAAVHSGWKGTVARIVNHTILEMQKAFGTNPSDIISGIGPSICPQCYEVGNEVIDEVNAAYDNADDLIIYKGGSSFFDLLAANQYQLLVQGVKPENIEIADMCTYEIKDNLFSARRDGPLTGRSLSGIILND